MVSVNRNGSTTKMLLYFEIKYTELSTNYAPQWDGIILDFIRIHMSWRCVVEVNDQRR